MADKFLIRQLSPRIKGASKQRGMTLIILIFLIGLAGTVFIIRTLNGTTALIERDKRTAQALEEAKAAIVSWSLVQTTPGRLPCPEDTTSIGTANEGQAAGSCSNSQPVVGRLAWRTLGLGDLRDGNGDRLWYARSPGFHSAPINSDTIPIITADGVQAAAIVFSPGASLGSQSRPVPTSAQPPDVANYLDSPNSTSNQTAFVSTPQSSSFNDRLLAIKLDDFMPSVEKLALNEAKLALNNYHTSHGYFPFAASLGATSNANQCVQNNLQGLLPTNTPGSTCSCTYTTSKTCSCTWIAAALTTVSYQRTGVSLGYFNNPLGACSVQSVSVGSDTCSCTGTGSCDRSTTPGSKRFQCDANGCKFLTTGTGNFKFYSSQTLSIPVGSMCTLAGIVVSCNVSSSAQTYTFTAGTCTDPEIPTFPASGGLPQWFTDNNWRNEIYYAVSCSTTSGGTAACTANAQTSPALLTVGGVTSVQALLAAPGRPFTSMPYASSKAAAQASRPSTDISDYLDSAENTNSDTTYDAVNTHRTSNYNDQMLIVAP